MNGCLSNLFGSKFGSQSFIIISQPSFEQYTQCSAPSSVFGILSSCCTSQIKHFSCFFLYCRVVAAFVLPADIFCPDFVSCPAIYIAFSELFLFSRQLALVRFYFHLQHMNMSTLKLNEFFIRFFFHFQRWTIIAEPSLARDERHRIAMAIDGSPGNVMIIGELQWSPSMGTFRPRF